MATTVTAPVVATRSGRLRGTDVDGISVFKGVRYAAPPFGANRFRPPQPVAPWSGVRDAVRVTRTSLRMTYKIDYVK